jgi:hypothetical protein
MQEMRAKDGSPLPVAGHMCRIAKLQSICAISYLHDSLLLGLLCGFRMLGLERDFERWTIHGDVNANKLRYACGHIWHYWFGTDWFYGVAHLVGLQGSNHN